MSILFMGTPDFAAVVLRRLIRDGRAVCGVFTQPDRPKNRGHKVAFSPVKEAALEAGIPVYQPVTLRDPAALDTVRALRPEWIVVAAYGKILPRALLDIPVRGALNVHSSLLPRYRGAAPVNWAVLNGETETGVSIMYMAEALDAGDVVLQKRTAVGPEEDAASLTARLADLGAEALLEALRAIEDGTAVRTPQDHSRATYAPMLSRALSEVDWTRPAHEIHCRIRGLLPWPCAVTESINGERLRLYAARETGEDTDARPGTVTETGKRGIGVACGDGKTLLITELQSPGGKRMGAADWLRGHSTAADR